MMLFAIRCAALVLWMDAGAVTVSRRRALGSLAGLTTVAPAVVAPVVAVADDVVVVAAPKVTDKVELELTLRPGTPARKVVIGLFGEAAPETAAFFRAVAAGTFEAPCAPSTEDSAVTENQRMVKRRALQICEGEQDLPVSYAASRVWRVIPNRRIDCGQVAAAFAFREAPALADESSNGLSHDAAGLLSMQRGGGTFDFTLLPAPNSAEFDGAGVVFGKILDGLDVLADLNALAVSDAAPFYPGFVKGEGKASSKASREACFYGSKELFCNQNRPLQKVVISSGRVVP